MPSNTRRTGLNPSDILIAGFMSWDDGYVTQALHEVVPILFKNIDMYTMVTVIRQMVLYQKYALETHANKIIYLPLHIQDI